MDDIAKNSGVSKKTIYAHFSNKTDLVEVVTDHLFETVCTGIDLIHEQQKNPIIELFDIKRFVMEHLKDEKSSPQYQLQKYYPKIYATLKQNQFEKMQGLIKENLDKGINQGLYRDSIDVDFIARIYFNGMVGIKDKDLKKEVKQEIKELKEEIKQEQKKPEPMRPKTPPAPIIEEVAPKKKIFCPIRGTIYI